MKKVLLGLVCVFSVLILVGCGNKEVDKLKQKITKENLVFVQTEENVCDSALTVQNKVILKTQKDENGEYVGKFQIYDCDEGAVNMILNNGTYKLNKNIIVFTNQYNESYKFKIINENEIVRITSKGKKGKKFELMTNVTSRSE